MSLKTVKETETSKISFLKTNGEVIKVYKEFFKERDLNKELLFISMLDSALKPEIHGNTLIYPYLTPLSEYLNRPMPETEALSLMNQCLEILEELNLKNVVHRDIKPGNLYLDSNKRLFLSDFESAIKSPDDKELNTCGTPGYMAPEQYKTPNVDWLADQYSLGAVFYKILTGCEAFDENTRTYEYQSSKNPDPSLENAKLKSTFCKTVQKLMNPLKEQRFQSITDIKNAIEECRQSLVKPVILEDKAVKIIPKQKAAKKPMDKGTYIILILLIILAAVLLKTL
ncbi:MAG: protein kinase [Lentisphaeraceae bacterium]|nr:protein kinase [Lentisphaeraceae bacterium]